ncbi:hypothetical protein [Pseudoduganella lutea]|uniref:Uncharacterized protein n=1 Tax=Pseudoduganella lutea TaxID=321985 RepID=A0A4P6L426_9BURK|nr:hypothetical protein [Pseudoduganella lutea]QBE66299.1 hypothetical protein EWM63_27715 [Pseudoduganella lutea]
MLNLLSRVLHMLKHILLIASAGFIAGWAMVKVGLATIPLLAGGLVAGALVALYLGLTFLVWLTRSRMECLHEDDDDGCHNDSLFGFDSRGDLRIDSDYPSRR